MKGETFISANISKHMKEKKALKIQIYLRLSKVL